MGRRGRHHRREEFFIRAHSNHWKAFRPAPGKRSIKVLQVLPYTFDCMDKEESLEIFNDYLKAVLLSMLFEDIFLPPSLVLSRSGETKAHPPSINYLAAIPPDALERVRKKVISECVQLSIGDDVFWKNKKQVQTEVRKIITESMIEEGLKTNIEEAAEQLYNSLTRKAVECSRSVNLRDLDIKLVEENPANIILAFLSRDCGFKTCQKLREQYNIFKNALNRNWNLRTALSVAKSCKSRAELIRKDKSVYGYLERNHPDELNKLFPYKIKYWDLSSALTESAYKLSSEFFIKAKGARIWTRTIPMS